MVEDYNRMDKYNIISDKSDYHRFEYNNLENFFDSIDQTFLNFLLLVFRCFGRLLSLHLMGNGKGGLSRSS